MCFFCINKNDLEGHKKKSIAGCLCIFIILIIVSNLITLGATGYFHRSDVQSYLKIIIPNNQNLKKNQTQPISNSTSNFSTKIIEPNE